MDSTLRRGLTQAWSDGAKKAGLLVGDLTEQEISKLQDVIFEQEAYVSDIMGWISTAKANEITISQVYDRIDLWLAVYNRVVDISYMMANADGKSKWIRKMGKDSCIDCVTYHGRVYRNSIWDKHEIHTQSRKLACGGLHCECGKEPTNDPITRGRPPAMTGAG